MGVDTNYETVDRILGHCGRMISASKSSYSSRFPTHVVVFNGNVCTKGHGKLWYGDIDITNDEAKLKELAATLGEDVYVLREMDGRFENEQKPLFEKARAVITPAGDVTINEVRYF